MGSEPKLEVGYGLGKGNDAFTVGVEAAKQALSGIRAHPLSLVMVFASVCHDLEELLRGIQEVVVDAPVVGGTTAGEICNGPHRESAVVVALASPYLEVRVGVGTGVARNWRQAVNQAVCTPAIAPFFSTQSAVWSELTLQGKSAFALLFSPGNTRAADSRSFEILEELKRLSEGRLPIMGGAAADDWRLETNYVLWGRRAYPDSLLVAVIETRLRFGLALAHGFSPTLQKATVTRTANHEVLELDQQPAAEVYSRLQGSSREELETKHLTLTTRRPVGIPDPYKQFSINVASFFTDAGGVRFSQPVPEGTILTIMEADEDNLVMAGQEALRKALLRGSITDPALILAFSCALRARILGERAGEEISAIKNIMPQVPVAGYYSFGEQGLADDEVNRHNNGVITILALSRELSYAAQVALENERLRTEVAQAEALKAAYAALKKEVAERQKAERAFRNGERFQASIFESIQDGLSILDLDLNLTRVNPTIERWYAHALPLPGKKCYRVYQNRDKPCAACPVVRTLATGKAAFAAVPKTGPEGEIIGWIDLYSFPLLDPASGQVRGAIGYARDITARQRAEEALRQSEEKFRLIAETIQDVFWISSPALDGIIYVSPAYEQLWGRTRESLYASPRSFLNAVHPEDRERVLANISRGHSQGTSWDHEYRLIRPDGSTRWVQNRGFPIKDDRGELRLLTGAATDITARKLAEEALQESEKNYRRIVEIAYEGIWRIDPENKIVFVNGRMAEMLGYTTDELLGQPISMVLEPEWLAIALGKIEARLRKGLKEQVDLKFRRRDGSDLWGIVSGTPILNHEGRYDGALGMVTDITRRKRAEEALRQSEEQLRQAQKLEAVGRLAGGIAHDFNNILTATSGYCELLLQHLERGDSRRRDVQGIQQATDRAATLIRQLLAFSRKQVIQPQRLNLNQVLANMDKMLRRLIREDIDLQTIPGPELGAVIADPGQIEQVIMNLVVNARDAMPEGGKLTLETANVELDETYIERHTQVKPGPYVLLAVSDTGVGLGQEVREHLFEPFFTTKKSGQGTGLGLSTVYGIVNHSGGFITVYSEAGTGATFKIYLPRLTGDLVEAKSAPLAISGAQGSETILLTEDEEIVRLVTRRILAGCGYTVLEAGSGLEAMKISRKHHAPIHLLLTDVVMPEMSGPKLAESLTACRPEMRVLYMSGHTENAIVHHGVLDPGIAFIQKPFRRDNLLRQVRQVLDSVTGADDGQVATLRQAD